ncbi:uncharacterized protein YcbK (DUF882 family) [Pseudaminobacter salicylatoxidans]|uniref:Murein endopeptidase K n=2 Tax=Pseudaminobacter salicylatoxidans TaxID=93369 RepID=A0A316C7V4_PSESE|nr:YcbK family protein [Pseudaminobacter salicylatoxidans]PWJ85819.1 uncharacterized protein YcbK (DUF882 family) [Pseudaminobacter salicylatoxidans]
MTAAGIRFAKRGSHAVLAALVSALLASCTSTSDPNLDFNLPAYNASASQPNVETAAAQTDSATMTITQNAEAGSPAVATVMDENDRELPVAVAYLPTSRPAAGGTISLQQAVEAEAEAERLAAVPAPAEKQQVEAKTETVAQAPLPSARPGEKPETAAAKPAAAQAPQTAQAETSAEGGDAGSVTAANETAKTETPKKKSFFASLFGSSSSASSATSSSDRGAPSPAAKPFVATNAAAKPLIDTKTSATPKPDAKPIIQLASANSPAKPLALASAGGMSDLPGVRQSELFEIKRKSGIDDDSDVDLHEEEDGGPIQVASAAGMARLAPNGLLRQTENVDVACLKPSLVRVLKSIEQHYGSKIVVTSGFRDPSRNRRARGAKNSLHMYCAAADVQVPGVSKWELANFVRSMPGRGGVGTYCHTNSVHVDVGPERDWNWRCSRRR